MTAALPAAVRANDAEALKEVGQSAQESPVLDLLMSHLASQLEKGEAGGPIRPLAATLARIGGDEFVVLLDSVDQHLRVGGLNLRLNLRRETYHAESGDTEDTQHRSL